MNRSDHEMSDMIHVQKPMEQMQITVNYFISLWLIENLQTFSFSAPD